MNLLIFLGIPLEEGMSGSKYGNFLYIQPSGKQRKHVKSLEIAYKGNKNE